jgi:hypothetical protein
MYFPSPCPRRGLGRGQTFVELISFGCVHDRLQDTVDIRQYLIVPKSEYSIIPFLDSPAAKPASRSRLPLGVLSAVELNHQLALFAAEVRDEITNRQLAAESQSNETSRAETMPQRQFGISLLVPQ